MSESSADFKKFMKQRKEASDAFVNGNINPLEKISVQTGPASIFGPNGDCIEEADRVNSANASSAEHFSSGSKNTFETVHEGAGDTFAYWVGIQRSVVQMKESKHGVPMDLRVTELFRQEEGAWKLFHRHADLLKTDDTV